MSRKEYIISLLKQEVRSVQPISPKPPTPTRKRPTSSANLSKHKTLKKRPKKYPNRTKPANTSASSSASNANGSSNGAIVVSSDSEIEFNVTDSPETPWIDSIDSNVTPSKSERFIEIESSSPTLDTIHHDSYIDHFNNSFFSSSEDVSSNNEDDELVLPENGLEVEEIIEEVRLNCYDAENGKVILIRNKDRVYLQGSLQLSLISGDVDVLGYHLSRISGGINMFSLRGFSYLYLENNCRDSSRTLDDIRATLDKVGVSKINVSSILSQWEPEDAIVFCSELNNLMLGYVEKHISQKFLPLNNECSPVILPNNTDNMSLLQCDSKWDEICEMVSDNSKLMICGGKGVGKSTLVRYTLNRLLMKYDKVLVIDLDPGQSEFTIPGCVSAVMMTEPVFGPSFTHLQQPERCIFIQNIDVSLDPDVYIKCVAELLKQCGDYKEIPILINYMGYTQSFGINIASTIITYVSPTILLQINSAQNTKNFSSKLTSDVVLEYARFFGAAEVSDLSYEFIVVNSMADGISSWQAQGRVTREMSILSYFSRVVDESLSLTSRCVPLYTIPLKDITLVCKNARNDINKLAVFNASLVSLCTPTSEDGIYNCLGWGIVRGIDQEILVLITPVNEEILATVTHLLVGSVTLPASILMYEDGNTGLVPYLSSRCKTGLNNIPKRSYLPKKTN